MLSFQYVIDSGWTLADLYSCIADVLWEWDFTDFFFFFSQKHVFSAHSVTSHVLNLFAFIPPHRCLATTQNTLLCHVSLGVCHTLVRNYPTSSLAKIGNSKQQQQKQNRRLTKMCMKWNYGQHGARFCPARSLSIMICCLF